MILLAHGTRCGGLENLSVSFSLTSRMLSDEKSDIDVGDGREGRSQDSQFDVVSPSMTIGVLQTLKRNRPGPPKTRTGIESTYFVPWKVRILRHDGVS